MVERSNSSGESVNQLRYSLIQGELALRLYGEIKDLGLGQIDLDKEGTLIRSNPFISARIDTRVRELGLGKVVTPYDLSSPEVMEIVRGRFYSDAPAFVVQSARDLDNPKNRGLLNQIISLVEERQGRVKFPFLVKGFDCQERYEIIPRDDFQIIEDENLSGIYNKSKFDEVDENGIPKKFVRFGKRTFWARNNGLSRLCLISDLGLYSDFDGLSLSNDNGRVVLVSGEAGTQNFGKISEEDIDNITDVSHLEEMIAYRFGQLGSSECIGEYRQNILDKLTDLQQTYKLWTGEYFKLD